MTYTVDGKVIGRARDVKTKYGMRSVVDVLTAEGQKLPVWKAVGDASIGRLCDGERVTLTLDGKGTVQTIEGSYDRVQAQRVAQAIAPSIEPNIIPTRPMGFSVNLPMEAERQLQRQIQAVNPVQTLGVMDYTNSPVTAIGSLFQECLAVADGLVGEADRVRVALALFDRLPSA
jgi:hypothetical protein